MKTKKYPVIELVRVESGDWDICSTCVKAIARGRPRWVTSSSDSYHDGCEPPGMIVKKLNFNDEVGIESRAG